VLRPLPLIRHKVPGLAAALASYLRRLRALRRRLPSRIGLAGPLRTQAEGRMLTLAGAAACALLGLIAVGGDTSSLSHAISSPARQLASPPGTTATTPATGSAPPAAPTRMPAPAPPATASCQSSYGLACYSPRQIQRAYDLPSLYARGLDGPGRTIVIVDSFGSPTIRHDLRVFDSAFGLPGPPSLRVLQPVGAVPRYDPHNQDMVDAAGETTTDVEAAHAIAPGASIVLAETPVAETLAGGGFPQFVAAENYVITHHLGDVISQSFGIPEQNFPSRAALLKLRSAFLSARRHDVTVLAATNDFGVTGPTRAGGMFRTQPVVDWPASDPLVTAVGGTTLHLTGRGRRVSPDSAWNESRSAVVSRYTGALPWASSGGVSAIFSRPAYQDTVRTVVGNRRGIPDVALSASFSGASLTFESFTGAPGTWRPAAGTSVATPYLAGIVAIADQATHTRLGLLNPALYRLEHSHAPGIVAVTRGGNTVSFKQGGKTITVSGYRAGPGYSLVTGVGTIDAARFVQDLQVLRASSCPAREDDHGRGPCEK
jgi:subtilase family serine protease